MYSTLNERDNLSLSTGVFNSLDECKSRKRYMKM